MASFRARSKDGTVVSCSLTGKGPPLVLIHGAGNSSVRWDPIVPFLEKFSLYTVDRRGRGESGDAPVYSLEREFEDAVAVVEAIGGPVDVLGHSLGGICAFEAALRTESIRRLILYEPAIPTGAPLSSSSTLEQLDVLLRAGDREGVLTTVMRDVIKMPERELEFLRNSSAWTARLEVAATLPRELRAIEDYRFEAGRFRRWKTPTLLLVGEQSPPFFKSAVQVLASNLAGSRTVVLAGQQHAAIDTAPGLFAQEVLRFLSPGEC